MLNRFRQWRHFHKTRNALMALSTRDLKDIGITRGDINRIARGV